MLLISAFSVALTTTSLAQEFELVSDGSAAFGAEANASSPWFSVSEDGRFVAFSSDAANLVEGDDNGLPDIFVRDRVSGTTERIPDPQTEGSELGRVRPDISDDGRWVVFLESTNNFDAGGFRGNVVLWDRQEEAFLRITDEFLAFNETPRISGNGQIVVFFASNLALPDGESDPRLVAFDRISGGYDTVTRNLDGEVAAGHNPALSADGRYVVFESDHDRFVDVDVNNRSDVFLADLMSGTIELLSISSAGVQSNETSRHGRISDDGSMVVFSSSGRTLVSDTDSFNRRVYLRNRLNNVTTLISRSPSGDLVDDSCRAPEISGSGQEVLFFCTGGDVAGMPVSGVGHFLHQVGNPGAIQAAVGSSNAEPAAIDSTGSVHVIERNLDTRIMQVLTAPNAGQVQINSVATDGQQWPAGVSESVQQLSANDLGDVLFITEALSLTLDGNQRAFIGEFDTPVVPLLNGVDGSPGNGRDLSVAGSGDGRIYVVETTSRNTLTDWDMSESSALVKLDRQNNERQLVAYGSSGGAQLDVSGDGAFAVFRSARADLVPHITNDQRQIFRANLATGDITLVSSDGAGTLAKGGTQLPSVSDDGRVVAYVAEADTFAEDPLQFRQQIFVKDMSTGEVRRIARPDGSTFSALRPEYDLSQDGRWLAIASGDQSAVANGPPSGTHIYLFDLATNDFSWISRGRFDSQPPQYDCRNPSMSADGEYVGFVCNRPDLITMQAENNFSDEHAYRYHRPTGTLELITKTASGLPSPGNHEAISLAPSGIIAAVSGTGTRLVPGVPTLTIQQALRATIGETNEVVFLSGFE